MAPAVLRVLLVEDQAGDAKLVELALPSTTEAPVELRRARRISEAVALLAEAPADAVLLDLGLPDSIGLRGLAAIRAAAPTAAVVVLSGSEDPELIWTAIENGAQEFEIKRIFPAGYLPRALRAAIVVREVRARLADPRPLEVSELGSLELLPDPVIVVDGTVPLFANAASRRMFGWGDGIAPALPPPLGSVVAAGSGPVQALEPTTRWGEGVTLGPDGRPWSFRYLVHIVRFRGGRRFLIRARSRDASARDSMPGPAVLPVPATRGALPVPPVVRTGGTVLDPTVWANLRDLAAGDPSFLPNLVRTFREYGTTLLAELAEASGRDDLEGIGRVAHTLKSSAAQVGALELSRSCRDLEQSVRDLRTPEVRRLVDDVGVSFRRALVALEAPPTG
jgi:CheY-like chemotaxis protein/HPt (histidine-containing phosphotransfer) domain-containing protein